MTFEDHLYSANVARHKVRVRRYTKKCAAKAPDLRKPELPVGGVDPLQSLLPIMPFGLDYCYLNVL